VKIEHAASTRRFAIVVLFCFAVVWLTGCAGRRSAAASAPPPIRPTPTVATPAPEPPVGSPEKPAARIDKPTAAEQPVAGGYTEEGNASWYGPTFHGKRASNGEVYDMNKLTAAHRTMAFNTMVRVTNLTNGKSVVVRITDRGPFVENRIIDLSKAAAQAIDSIGPGVVPVRVEVVSGNDPYPPAMIQQVALDEGTFYRVRVGRILGEQSAQRFADELKVKEGFHSMVVRLDEDMAGGGTQ
jgi:rare lipoprotein A